MKGSRGKGREGQRDTAGYERLRRLVVDNTPSAPQRMVELEAGWSACPRQLRLEETDPTERAPEGRPGLEAPCRALAA